MHSSSSAILVAVLALASCVAAQSASATGSATASAAPASVTHVITVANNQTADNGTAVFTPQSVNASLHDTVIFNFTEGTHSATQSTFANPCIPAHDTNSTINGFNSDLRPAGNGTAITQLVIVMNPDIINDTLWFFDQSTCGIGGVGVINAGNVTATWEPLDAFVRNAIRLNGTASTSSAAPASTGGSSGSSGSSGGSSGTSSSDGGSGSNSTGAALAVRVAPTVVLAPLLALAAALLV
ncbi:hypothetical protein C8F04DRAFT_315559 [Mycena alexandri]|uniref:Uncharacterized protein n=1 Tax=Mycena alexandri TaxID=1745969 RepID=A0AAD6T765_9AGAR|nr:hypothetical protein C8F04DRAFT_315559 [Mycena alexandri]